MAMAKKNPPKKAPTRPVGRPVVNPPDLDKRYMIRCSEEDWRAWDTHARSLGFNGAAPLIRKHMNELMASVNSKGTKKAA
jgi:hypothetical protein